MAETPGGGACDDEASEAVGSDSAGEEYLKMGVAPGWQAKDKVEELAFVAEHGKAVSRLLAYTVCRGYVSRHVGIGVTAWVLRNFVEWRYLTAMFRTFERLMGTKDFMRIISSTARANPMTPRLSQARKGVKNPV